MARSDRSAHRAALPFFFPRSLLCNLVRVKLGCYELEGKNTLSLEDYLKAFMETEVKPLWPKGWMQARLVSFSSGGPLRRVSPGRGPRGLPAPADRPIPSTQTCLVLVLLTRISLDRILFKESTMAHGHLTGYT